MQKILEVVKIILRRTVGIEPAWIGWSRIVGVPPVTSTK